MNSIDKQCLVSGKPFAICVSEQELREQLAFELGGRRFNLPAPQLSPEERQRRRLAFRNERYLYRNRSAISGKPLVSSYSPDKSYKVVSRDEWNAVDNTDFGRELDFSKPVFPQFQTLLSETYKTNVIQDGEMVNSEYCHFCGWNKNCYLTFDSGKSQDCSYGALYIYCKDCYDCFYAIESELCYDCVKIHNCYQLFSSQFAANCSFSAFLTDCIGCKNCLCCTNLRNKEYFVFNEYVGKQRFELMWQEFFSGSFRKLSALAESYERFILTAPKRALRNVDCENSSGDLLHSCLNALECFNCSNARNIAHCHDCIEIESSMDISMFGEGMHGCYELSGCGGARGKAGVSNTYFSTYIFYGGYNILYSIGCHQNCKNLFLCSDLNGKSFCVLNKQYSQSEYEQLVPKVIAHMERTGEWGEFFPISLSPYGYNESIAQEFLPLSREEAVSLGANWSDYISPTPTLSLAFNRDNFPDSFKQLQDLPEGAGIECDVTGKAFKPTPGEMQFYLTHGLPLPRLHPEERQRLRSRRLNPRRLQEIKCSSSGADILTSYAGNLETVVSEEVYQRVLL